MNQNVFDNFRMLVPLMLPELIDINRLDGIDDYDDYALLSFTLPKPLPVESVVDMFEDQMELSILYYVRYINQGYYYHCCAYSKPMFEHMYKLNLQTNIYGLVENIYVYVFQSLETMLESLKEDLEIHYGEGVFLTRMSVSKLIADFM